MAINNGEELFVWLLSNVRQREEKMKDVLQEISQAIDDQDIKERIDARLFVRDSIIQRIDKVFKTIGKQPVKTTERMQDVFIEDFRKEIAEIRTPAAKALFAAARLSHLMHMHIGEYTILTAMADISGHYSVGTLLETCLADNMAFVERTRRRIRRAVEARMAERLEEAVA
jgi:ferritin-like metal-binding protein YciE